MYDAPCRSRRSAKQRAERIRLEECGLHRKMKRKDRMPETSHSDRPGALPARALAYLISTYPTLSMTFVLREVLALRELGFQVETASINMPDRRADELTQAEADEAKRTYYVKQHGISGATVAKLQTVFGNFRGYWRGVALAF